MTFRHVLAYKARKQFITEKGLTMRLTDKLIRTIKRSRITRYRIAKDTGVSQSLLSRFVSGERSISLETAELLCDYFKLELVEKAKRRKG